ncbi:hypothetical protein P43SY_003075 [Pythium insidiosum]|uniref:Fibronectin type-III domain-containing protein n=1 Tax=Pythium insidiosum TaxID=114742 RepID=A0AAD5LRV4_PYTIN|nr:hypothetical protein P43SY_003075 [Pythium insidiosum]
MALARFGRATSVQDARHDGDTATSSGLSVSPVSAPSVLIESSAIESPGHVQLHTLDGSLRSPIDHDSSVKVDSQSATLSPALLPVRAAIGEFLRLNWIAIGYTTLSVGLMVLLVYLSYFAASMTDGSGGAPGYLSCRAWSFGTDCGYWGINCRPFESDWMAFRCRTKCGLDPELLIYGSGRYRADSRICKAAIHAGVIGHNGGCALMKYSGASNSFPSSEANGITSRAFLSWFPKTIEFKAAPSRFCTDLTWPILVIGVLLCMGFALVPRTNAGMLYALLVGWGFVYVRLVGQPSSVDYTWMAISSFSDVFVLLAASSWLYRLAPARTFSTWPTLSLKQRVVLWSSCYVLPYHVLLNMNLFDNIPWLNVGFGGYSESSKANAGTYIVFGLMGVVILVCAFRFLRELYRQGVWRRLVAWYALLIVLVLLTWALFPASDFHLHHTMFGALLLPLTPFPTPLAAAAQSAMLGVFVHGYAAWGWDTYLTSPPTYLTINVPEKAPVPQNVTQRQVTVSWEPVEAADGYSLKLNRVEVYRGVDTTATVSGLEPNLTYFLTVAAVADWGVAGRDGPRSNFTTLP